METGLQSEVKIRVRRLRVWLRVICCFYFGFVIFFNYYFFARFMCSCSLFSMPLIFTLMAASISPFPHRRYKILMFFFRRNWSPLFFTLALALSLLSTTIQTLKLSRKKESALLLLFLLLKVREAMRFTAETCRNVRVLEMQNFIPAYMRGWTYVTVDLLRTKISWMHRLPNFLTHGVPLRALRARESSAIKTASKQVWL